MPVRSSYNTAPRLHQSHASVILDTPPILLQISKHNATSYYISREQNALDMYYYSLMWLWNNSWNVSPGALYISSIAFGLISGWTSVHCPKYVRHASPVRNMFEHCLKILKTDVVFRLWDTKRDIRQNPSCFFHTMKLKGALHVTKPFQ